MVDGLEGAHFSGLPHHISVANIPAQEVYGVSANAASQAAITPSERINDDDSVTFVPQQLNETRSNEPLTSGHENRWLSHSNSPHSSPARKRVPAWRSQAWDTRGLPLGL